MNWPPKKLWRTIAALWATCGTPSAGTNERAKAFAALRQYQNEYALSNCVTAYIAEHQALEPAGTAEREYNAFDVALHILSKVGLVMPFEYLVLDAAWSLHTYVFRQSLHTPCLMIWSRGSGFGKTVRMSAIKELAHDPFYMIAPTPAVLYRYIDAHPGSSLFLDDMEHADWQNKHSLFRQIFDAGHRQGVPVPRVENREVVSFETFAPMTVGLIIPRFHRDIFPQQVTTRSIKSEMKFSAEGLDEIWPGDPRFVSARIVISQWADIFQYPTSKILLPPGLVARCGNNWRPLAAVCDALGYGATLRAAAVAIEAANFDPEIKLYEDTHEAFERRQVDRFWTGELIQALKEISDIWTTLTSNKLYDWFYRKGIDYKTIWKTNAGGTRKSNNGFKREQFEPVWRELDIEHSDTQSSKIIQIAAHKRHTSDPQGGPHGE
jgi:hypothetical protein